MKILSAIVIPPHLPMSGAVNAAKALSQALAEHCQVDIALMAYENKEVFLGEARLLERRSFNPLQFTNKFLPDKFRTLFYYSDIPDLVRNHHYDVVHLHNAIPTLEMKRIAQACVERKIPYVVSTHGFVELTTKGEAYSLKLHERLAGKYLIDRPLKYVVDHSTLIFALSPMEVPILTKLGIPLEKIAIVTNGVNKFFCQTPSRALTAQVCTKFHLPIEKDNRIPVGFYLGNHTQNKGIHVLLDALMLMDKPYQFIIGGKKRETIKYESYAARCGQSQRIIFTDMLTDEEILGLFHYADLFVFPTLADTLPLVILEAMSAGLPILSTKVGGIPYQVDDSCGYLVEPNDPVALKEGFEQLTKNDSQLYHMANAAKKAVHEKFNWENSAETAFTLYKKISNP